MCNSKNLFSLEPQPNSKILVQVPVATVEGLQLTSQFFHVTEHRGQGRTYRRRTTGRMVCLADILILSS